MVHFKWLALLLVLISGANCAKPNLDVTSIDYLMANCKHFSSFHYEYTKFFPLNSFLKPTFNENYKVLVNVSIVSDRDAHIMLTKEDNKIGNVYEMIFGGDDNRISYVREEYNGAEIMRIKSGIPSQIKPFFVQLSVKKDDTLEVKDLETSNIILIAKHNNLDINYISFASFSRSRSDFYFDCVDDAVDNEAIYPYLFNLKK